LPAASAPGWLRLRPFGGLFKNSLVPGTRQPGTFCRRLRHRPRRRRFPVRAQEV